MDENFAAVSADIEKAEGYLYTDSAACMTYISRALEGTVKAVCEARNIPLRSDGQDRKLVELIDELGRRKIAGRKILHLLHNLRMHRNRNAHNESVSLADNMKLIEEAREVHEWFANVSGQKKQAAPQKERHDDSSYVKTSLNAIMNEYARNPAAASRKYEGKLITITGATVQAVRRSGQSDEIIVTLLSKYETVQSGASIAYNADCFYPARHEARVRNLKEGEKFAATGIWKGRKLTGCVWSSDKVSVHSGNMKTQVSRHESRKHGGCDEIPLALRVIIAAAAVIIVILLGRS